MGYDADAAEERHLDETWPGPDKDTLRRERDAAQADRDYWKRELLSEQADYDKARKERDALKEALIRASQRLGDLGARVPDNASRRTIAEVVADISQALAALEEA